MPRVPRERAADDLAPVFFERDNCDSEGLRALHGICDLIRSHSAGYVCHDWGIFTPQGREEP